jgi:hypothetical protein
MNNFKVLVALAAFFSISMPAAAQSRANKGITLFSGASIVGQDAKKTFLGKIDNPFGRDSIFNEFSTYGNEISPKSIWNEINIFGGEISQYSPFNPLALQPPMIIKNGKLIGYLTCNPAVKGGISVQALFNRKDWL